MPLPIPRCVMSSPIHMISAVPAVRISTMSPTRGAVNEPGGKTSGVRNVPLWNANARPVDCSSASTIVT